jgi:hypothetical protein
MPNIYLDPPMERLAREYARKENRSLSNLVQCALQEWIFRHAERPRVLVDTSGKAETEAGDVPPQ